MNFIHKEILAQKFKKLVLTQIQPLSSYLTRLLIQPDVITLSSLIFAVGAGICCAFGRFQLSLPFLLLIGLSNMLDRQVARRTGHITPFGALQDLTVDRLAKSDILIRQKYQLKKSDLRQVWNF
jgi:CDP-diacylglycerol---glycerol-3-phosphate 3-phosphatidyltransferase